MIRRALPSRCNRLFSRCSLSASRSRGVNSPCSRSRSLCGSPVRGDFRSALVTPWLCNNSKNCTSQDFDASAQTGNRRRMRVLHLAAAVVADARGCCRGLGTTPLDPTNMWIACWATASTVAGTMIGIIGSAPSTRSATPRDSCRGGTATPGGRGAGGARHALGVSEATRCWIGPGSRWTVGTSDPLAGGRGRSPVQVTPPSTSHHPSHTIELPLRERPCGGRWAPYLLNCHLERRSRRGSRLVGRRRAPNSPSRQTTTSDGSFASWSHSRAPRPRRLTAKVVVEF